MRFHFQIGMCDSDHYLPLAKAVEAAGYHGVTVPDSICYPKEASSKYPYNADGSREFLETVPFIESLIAVTAMAAVTERLRFATFVYKLAVRQIAGVAKQVQGIQAISNNRFDFGVGISPWEEDFAVMQTPWEKRGKRLDEQMDILRGLETGEYYGFEGELHSMPANRMRPVPSQRTPLLVGGHSKVALNRAALKGDGWMCAGAETDQLQSYIEQLKELRKQHGTEHKPFSIYAGSAEGFSKEGIATLEAIGVTDLIVGFRDLYAMQPDHTLEEKIEMLEGYASHFIV
ncbi:MAG: TIGR03619 family F420-dependent LLM class oxidoreductase [Pseudomonadales bacterium]